MVALAKGQGVELAHLQARLLDRRGDARVETRLGSARRTRALLGVVDMQPVLPQHDDLMQGLASIE
jgi:hypothetical protein